MQVGEPHKLKILINQLKKTKAKKILKLRLRLKPKVKIKKHQLKQIEMIQKLN
jgi:hypothetical protein